MSLIQHHMMLGNTPIVYFGSANVPNDNVINSASPMIITPPSNMKAGDFVFVHMYCGSNGPRTGSISVTGGQTWTLTKDRSSSLPEIWHAWCTFNGTWSANPRFDISGSAITKSTIMHVFRPPRTTAVWAVDQAVVLSSVGGGTDTTTITGVTNTGRGVTIVANINADVSNTYTSLSGTNWRKLGGAQYRNPGANAKASSYAYQIQELNVPFGATGNVSITWSGTSTAWYNTIQSFSYT
jgi:hypothetical protein